MINTVSDPQTELKGKKVLITGGLGFVGSNLAHRCVELGAEVTIYDSLASNSGGNIYNINDIRNDVKVIFSDILDSNEVTHAVYEKDILFNCAASTSHPLSMHQPFLDLDVNSKGLLILLDTARRFNRSIKFIHIGTSTQLGILKYTPADEQHPEFPTDIYSANKSVSEKYAMIYSKAYGMDITVIRLSNCFGPRACISSPDFTFNNYFIGLALQNKEITIFGEGRQLRNFLYISDAVSALISASLTPEIFGDVYFAVGDEHCSVADIAKKIISVFGKGSLRFINWPPDRKATEIGDAIISNKKIKECLGWKPEFSLERGLQETKEYFDKHKSFYL